MRPVSNSVNNLWVACASQRRDSVLLQVSCAVATLVAFAALACVGLMYRAKVRAERSCAWAMEKAAATRRECDQTQAALDKLRRTDPHDAQAQTLEAARRLAGGIAHDFNNLLTAITGYTELLIAEFDAGDSRLESAYEIRSAALAAARLISHLLAFSRNQPVPPEALDLKTAS